MFPILTTQGIEKLTNLISQLTTLKETLHSQTLVDAASIYISTDYSIQMLNDLISLANEAVKHNTLPYWVNKAQQEKLEKFFSHFDNNMGNFVPACFDRLSYEITKIYLEVLTAINPSTDIVWSTKPLIPFSLDKLLPSLKDNTHQQIKLFEFIANGIRTNECATQPEEFIVLGNLIRHTKNLVTNIKNQEADKKDENIQSYQFIFEAEATDTTLQDLSIQEIINQYQVRISSLLTSFSRRPDLSEVSIGGLSGFFMDGKKRGAILGNEPINLQIDEADKADLFQHLFISNGSKGFHLQALLLEERELLTMLPQNCSLPEGIINSTINTFNTTEYLGRFEQLKSLIQTLQGKLTLYSKKSDGVMIARTSRSPDKIKTANKIIKALNALSQDMTDTAITEKYINHYLGSLLALLLKESILHNLLIGSQQLSHGKLGEILTEALNNTYSLVESVSIRNSPDLLQYCVEPQEMVELFTLPTISSGLT